MTVRKENTFFQTVCFIPLGSSHTGIYDRKSHSLCCNSTIKGWKHKPAILRCIIYQNDMLL